MLERCYPEPRESIRMSELPEKRAGSFPENEEIENQREEIRQIKEKLRKEKEELKVLIGEEQKECCHENEVRVLAEDVNYGKDTIQGWLCLDCGRYRPRPEGSARKVCRRCGRPTMEFDREYHVAADMTKTEHTCTECNWTYGWT